jgi:radical SAM superfamily enzyme YgiQ (UPF0313 family)
LSLKVLLVVPPVTLEERYGVLKDVGTSYPSLGLAYIAAVAEKAGHEARVVDSEALGTSYDYIRERIAEFKPDAVGMQTFCTNVQQCCKVAAIAKNANPNCAVILGGAQATLLPEQTLADANVDYVVLREGEISFVKLLEAIENKAGAASVKGIAWKDYSANGGRIVVNAEQELINDLDSIPMPARHLFPMEKYHSSAQLRGTRTLNIMTSRGCPFRCAYCSGHINFGRTHRFHSARRVIDEIKILMKDYRADSIQFFDETFTFSKPRVLELCEKMIEEKIKVSWAAFSRVNTIDRELLDKMREAGCYQIFYGVESGNQRLLDLIHKDITLDQARKAIKMTREAGIESFASFMLALPTETVEESRKTIDFAIELDPDYAQFPITTPFPGTELYEIAKKSGSFVTEDWSKFMSWDQVVYVPEGRSAEEVKRTAREAYRRFYLRPKYVARRAWGMRKLPPNKIINLVKSGVKTFVS